MRKPPQLPLEGIPLVVASWTVEWARMVFILHIVDYLSSNFPRQLFEQVKFDRRIFAGIGCVFFLASPADSTEQHPKVRPTFFEASICVSCGAVGIWGKGPREMVSTRSFQTSSISSMRSLLENGAGPDSSATQANTYGSLSALLQSIPCAS